MLLTEYLIWQGSLIIIIISNFMMKKTIILIRKLIFWKQLLILIRDMCVDDSTQIQIEVRRFMQMMMGKERFPLQSFVTRSHEMTEKKKKDQRDKKNEKPWLPWLVRSMLAVETSKMRWTTEETSIVSFWSDFMTHLLTNISVDYFPQNICRCFHIEWIDRCFVRNVLQKLHLDNWRTESERECITDTSTRHHSTDLLATQCCSVEITSTIILTTISTGMVLTLRTRIGKGTTRTVADDYCLSSTGVAGCIQTYEQLLGFFWSLRIKRPLFQQMPRRFFTSRQIQVWLWTWYIKAYRGPWQIVSLKTVDKHRSLGIGDKIRSQGISNLRNDAILSSWEYSDLPISPRSNFHVVQRYGVRRVFDRDK